MGKRCQKIFLENVKSMDKLTEKSEYQVPMDGEEREVSSRSNSETFSYVSTLHTEDRLCQIIKAKTEFLRERREKKEKIYCRLSRNSESCLHILGVN